MNKLPKTKRAHIIGMMVEGMSISAVSRLAVASRNTVVKLLVDAGEACSAYQDQAFRNLLCRRVQVDVIRSFVFAEQKNVPVGEKSDAGDAGDVWTWTAICADTKLVPSWLAGARDTECATHFICELSQRLASRAQLTSDGHCPYLETAEAGFVADVNHAALFKIYGQHIEAQKRDIRPQIAGARTLCCEGEPKSKHATTSYGERQNLNMRMGTRIFARSTNALSKKVENHIHAISIYFMHYNFVRIHQTLRVTPAMAAGVTDNVWELTDIVRIVDDRESARKAASLN